MPARGAGHYGQRRSDDQSRKGVDRSIGPFARKRTLQFQFKETGFAVGNGTPIVANSHVVFAALGSTRREVLAILMRAWGKDQVQISEAKRLCVDPDSNLDLLKIEGPAIPALKLRDLDTIWDAAMLRCMAAICSDA
jgi:hypothetical protein